MIRDKLAGWFKTSVPHQHSENSPIHEHRALYHVAPSDARDNIGQDGIKLPYSMDRNYPLAYSGKIFAWSTPHAAKKYADDLTGKFGNMSIFNPMQKKPSYDIWKIKLDKEETWQHNPTSNLEQQTNTTDRLVGADYRVPTNWGHAHEIDTDHIKPEQLELHTSDIAKESSWKDVRQKGKTISAEGAVDLIRSDKDVIVAQVIGDHDTYAVEIYRQYPGEAGVTMWTCSCKWGDWAFNRTLYNGRMCSHALAALYASQRENMRTSSKGMHLSHITNRPSIARINSEGKDHDVNIEIANNPSAIMHGLMHRTYLPWDSGMAFLFNNMTSDGFWMRNTLIPLSIAFWDSEGVIISLMDMEPNPDPLNAKVYKPDQPYRGALEVNQGFFDFYNIKIGDTITVIE